MKQFFFLFFCCTFAAFAQSNADYETGSTAPSLQVLVFTKTTGYRHESISEGIELIRKLGAKNGFKVIQTEDASLFNDDELKKYQLVIFLSTTGDVLNNEQEVSFQKFIRSGRSFMGIHSATDTEYQWKWYGGLVGAYFLDHPKQQFAVVKITEPAHAATKGLQTPYKRFDEWYNFKDISEGIHVIMVLDESTYQGGSNGKKHPFAWYHEYEGGRSFYTAGGHTRESYSEDFFVRHLEGGIRYCLGMD